MGPPLACSDLAVPACSERLVLEHSPRLGVAKVEMLRQRRRRGSQQNEAKQQPTKYGGYLRVIWSMFGSSYIITRCHPYKNTRLATCKQAAPTIQPRRCLKLCRILGDYCPKVSGRPTALSSTTRHSPQTRARLAQVLVSATARRQKTCHSPRIPRDWFVVPAAFGWCMQGCMCGCFPRWCTDS